MYVYTKSDWVLLSSKIHLSSFQIFIYLFCFYLKGRGTDRKRKTGLSSSGSLPKCTQQPGLSQEPGIKPESSIWMAETQLLGHNLLSPRMHISSKLESEAEPGLEHRYSNTKCRLSQGILTASPNTCPESLEFYFLNEGWCFAN